MREGRSREGLEEGGVVKRGRQSGEKGRRRGGVKKGWVRRRGVKRRVEGGGEVKRRVAEGTE